MFRHALRDSLFDCTLATPHVAVEPEDMIGMDSEAAQGPASVFLNDALSSVRVALGVWRGPDAISGVGCIKEWSRGGLQDLNRNQIDKKIPTDTGQVADLAWSCSSDLQWAAVSPCASADRGRDLNSIITFPKTALDN